MKALHSIGLALAWALAAAGALACEPIYDPDWRDAPVSVAPDCSFTDAGNDQNWAISGKKAQSLGNGHVVQVLVGAGACTARETLLVISCETGAMVGVEGIPDRNAPDFGSGPELLAKNIVRPKGAIRLNKRTTVDSVIKAATRRQYTYKTKPGSIFGKLSARNRFDPFCGCKLHYPDSKGASQ